MRFLNTVSPLLLWRWLSGGAPAPGVLSEPPTITLPWGTWAATHYDERDKFYTFTNVRYGKAPTGQLRFSASRYPDAISNPQELQDTSYGPACPQINAATCDCPPADCPTNGTSVTQHGFLRAQSVGATSEDCLFLDLYVPESALVLSNSSLPVVVWIHGGGFIFGAKDSHDEGIPLYNGTGVLHAARELGEEMIFVAINYRLGAFGWMAGPSMEEGGTPNAGLHDQRLALQWVQDHIHLVGGNRDQVSAWGESAGGGSILSHLVAENGSRDPLFRRAVVQSPGFEWQYDRSSEGRMERAFRNFSRQAGCDDYSLDCLRGLDESVLKDVNQATHDAVKCAGMTSFGPAVDGSLIRQLPIVSYRKEMFWKDLDSIIVSHVADETKSFVPKFIVNETDFSTFLAHIFPQPDLDLVRAMVANRYASNDVHNSTAILIRDAFFTCNVRQLLEAYRNVSSGRYLMQYDFLSSLGLAVHAADLLALFWNPDFDVGAVIAKQYPATPSVLTELVSSAFGDYAQQYQTYFVSHAVAKDPNMVALDKLPLWAKAKEQDDGMIKNALETGYSFFGNYFSNDTVDPLLSKGTCDFWGAMAELIDAKYGK